MAASWSNAEVLAQLNSGAKWTGSIITYSFPASPGSMYSGSGAELAGFRAATYDTQVMFQLAIQAWDDLIAPNFQQGTPGSTSIEVAFTSTGIGYAHAYYPTAGSVWLNSYQTSGAGDLEGAPIGTHGFYTYLHELGHALGLRHMGDYNGAGTWSPSSYQDSTVLSVMSYFGPTATMNHSIEVAQADWDNNAGSFGPQTPMLNDIMAIQSIYGISTNTRTDNTTYGFNSTVGGSMQSILDFSYNANPVLTIFDSGGIDTLDLSGWGTVASINLASGAASSANGMTNNIWIAYTCTIENAAGGGSADLIVGNAVANVLAGNGGNDDLRGDEGNDTLAGGSGNDTLAGGGGTDTGVFGASFASYTITFNSVTGTWQLVNASTGTDFATGLEFFQFSDQTRSAAELTSSDTGAPTLTSASPIDNATGVATGTNIVLNFSETVQAGSGTITIFNGNGTVAHTISVTDTSQVTVQGSTVTINPASNLAGASNYYVLVAAGAVKDLAGNAFAGISSNTTLNFTTVVGADIVAPLLVSTAPADNATGVAIGANLVLTFSESVQAGSGNITIFNGNGSVARTIAANDASQVIFSGSTVTINPGSDFAYGSNYYVQIAPGAIIDSTGNAYAGISNTTSFSFSTAASSNADDYPFSFDTSGVVLTNGSATAGNISFDNDQDMFRVSLVAGVEYEFDLVALTLDDPFLILYDPNGLLVTSDDDGGPLGFDSRITYVAATTGTYYLGAMNLELTGGGTYLLSASGSGDDYPWSTTTTGVVTVNSGATGGVIDFADDFDLLKVQLQAGQTYVFDVTSTGLDDPYMFLYDPSVALIAEDDDGGDSLDSRIEYTATTTGTYYIGIADYSTGTGSYNVTATASGDDYPWSTVTTGVVTVGGAARNGEIDYAGDLDLLKVTLTAGVTYSFELQRTGGGLDDPYLRLYDPSVVIVAFDDDSGGSFNSRITFTATTSGTYYLGVSDYDLGTGGYTVLARIVDVTAPTLNSTTPADNATGVAVGANITMTFNEPVRAGSGNILVYASNGTIARSISVTDTSQVSFSGNTLTINPSSDLGFSTGYYVNMAAGVVTDAAGNGYAGIGNSTGFNFTTAAPAVSDDFPLTVAGAGSLSVGGSRTGTINYGYDGDMFKVTLTAGTSYRFDLTRSGGNPLTDPYLQLFNSDLELQALDDDGGSSGNSRLFFTAAATGTYYLVAWDYSTGTGGYTVSAATASDDHPFTVSSAPLLALNTNATGEIDFAGDGDLFKVTLVQGATYLLDLRANASGGLDDPYLFLYDSALSQVAFDDDSAGALDSRIVFTPSQNGTYYLGAFDYASGSGTYTLRAAQASVITGTSNADSLSGGSAVEVIRGEAGADLLTGNGGNDHLEGGDGIDFAVYAGARSNYDVAIGFGAATVSANSGGEGNDTLVDVERAQFSNGKIALDLDGNAGIVAKTLGAVFGSSYVDQEAYVGIGLSLVDGGMSYASLMQLALNVRLGAGATHAQVVNLLYTNVIGVAPDAGTRAVFVSMLDGGTFTPATLGVLAANTSYNLVNIDFTGLSETGIEYT